MLRSLFRNIPYALHPSVRGVAESRFIQGTLLGRIEAKTERGPIGLKWNGFAIEMDGTTGSLLLSKQYFIGPTGHISAQLDLVPSHNGTSITYSIAPTWPYSMVALPVAFSLLFTISIVPERVAKTVLFLVAAALTLGGLLSLAAMSKFRRDFEQAIVALQSE